MVRSQADKLGLQMPEVGIYEGEPNAFATGASKNSSLVAVSTGLLSMMNQKEVEAVLAHEMSHVANGDMVTMTLVQGVTNTFVVFLSRLIGWVVDRQILRNEDDAPGIGYYVTSIVLDIAFGLLAGIIVAAFSRYREFRADAGAAQVMNSPESKKRLLPFAVRETSDLRIDIGHERPKQKIVSASRRSTIIFYSPSWIIFFCNREGAWVKQHL